MAPKSFTVRSPSVLDPIAALVVGIFIFKVSFFIIKQSIDELLETSLGEKIEKEIIEIVRQIPGVKNPHNLKTRKVGSNYAIDIHIDVNSLLNIKEGHDISTEVEQKLKSKFGSDTVISVHIEPES